MLHVEDRQKTRWLTLDWPHRNAIPPDGWEELRTAFADFERSEARVLIVTGAGGDFCSGADLGAGEENGSAPPGGVVARHLAMKQVDMAASTLHRLNKPTIAAVDGVAVGAGMNLALGCDVVLATNRARFAEIFVKRGLVMDFGGSWLLPRHVGMQRAKELALSGRVVGADEALSIGLVLELVAPEELDHAAEDMAAAFAAGAPVGQMFTKRAINNAAGVGFDAALAYEGQAQAICLSSADAVEGFTAFLEKREPHFRGR